MQRSYQPRPTVCNRQIHLHMSTLSFWRPSDMIDDERGRWGLMAEGDASYAGADVAYMYAGRSPFRCYWFSGAVQHGPLQMSSVLFDHGHAHASSPVSDPAHAGQSRLQRSAVPRARRRETAFSREFFIRIFRVIFHKLIRGFGADGLVVHLVLDSVLDAPRTAHKCPQHRQRRRARCGHVRAGCESDHRRAWRWLNSIPPAKDVDGSQLVSRPPHWLAIRVSILASSILLLAALRLLRCS